MADAPATPTPATEAAPTSVTSSTGPAAGPGGQPNANGDAALSTPDAPKLPPRYSELGQAAKARLEEQKAREQREQDARDAQTYREMMARGWQPQAHQQPQREQPKSGRRVVEVDLDDYDSLRQALGGDPSSYRVWLNGAAKHAIDPNAVRLERELQAVKGKLPEGLEELRQQVETLSTERQAERAERIQQRFLADTEVKGDDGSPRFPLLAKLDPSERIDYAQGMIAKYVEAGYTPQELPNDFIMGQVEEWLGGFVGRFLPAPAPAAPAPVATQPAPTSKRPQGGQPKRQPPGLRTVSNDMGTPQGEVDERSLPPAEREKLREKRALDRMQARRAAGR